MNDLWGRFHWNAPGRRIPDDAEGSDSSIARGSVLASAKLHLEPGASRVPVALHGARGNCQNFRGFPFCKSPEIPQFDDARLPPIHGCQAVQRFIENQHLIERRVRDGVPVFQFHA